MCPVLDTTSNVEIILATWEYVCRLYANIMPFYKGSYACLDLGTLGDLESIPPGKGGTNSEK
jgi:hypothetical protein